MLSTDRRNYPVRSEIMDIVSATKEALAFGCLMTRDNGRWKGYVAIKPTNTAVCCVMYTRFRHNGEYVCNTEPYWNPKAEDIIADDWELTSEKWLQECPSISKPRRRNA